VRLGVRGRLPSAILVVIPISKPPTVHRILAGLPPFNVTVGLVVKSQPAVAIAIGQGQAMLVSSVHSPASGGAAHRFGSR